MAAAHPGQAAQLSVRQAMQAGGPEFDIPLDRQQLADYLAVDRSAMSTALGSSGTEGVLTFQKTISTCFSRWSRLTEEESAMLTRVPDYYERFTVWRGPAPTPAAKSGRWWWTRRPPAAIRRPLAPWGAAAGGAPDGRGGGFLLPPPGGRVPLSEPRESVRDPRILGAEATSLTWPDPPPVH